MNKFPSFKYVLLTVIISLLSITTVELFPSLFEVVELKSWDMRFKIRDMLGKNPSTSANVYNLSIDDYSINEEDIYFWSRSKFGIVLEKMAEAGTGVIACDMIFRGYSSLYEDTLIVASFAEAGNIVTAYIASLSSKHKSLSKIDLEKLRMAGLNYPQLNLITKNELLFFTGFRATSFPELNEMSLSSGFININADQDGVVRRFQFVTKTDSSLIPSLPLSALCAYLDYKLEDIILNADNELILKSASIPGKDLSQDLRIKLDKNGKILINYTGKLNPENYPNSFSAIDILHIDDAGQLEPQLADKIGIFSDVSSVGKDFCTTPLETFFPNSFLYTNILSSILQNNYLSESHDLSNYLIIFLILAGLTILTIYTNVTWILIYSAVTGISYFFLNTISFVNYGLILPIFPVYFPLVVIIIFSLIFKYIHEIKRFQFIESNLRSYLSPKLLEKFEKHPEMLRPGGQRKKITVLFSDIAGFTAFCDRSEPEEVQEVLDEYLAIMAEVVFNNDGIIDKYMGDGLLAFFENENEEVISAINAVKTAVAMQNQTKILREKWVKQNRLELHIRVGLSTGYATVGNLGPPQKIDYTVIGSSVNMAARLQSLGDFDDIISDKTTRHLIVDSYESTYMGEKDIKGFGNTTIYKINYDLGL